MSLDRSPSPNRNGGWSSPGLAPRLDEGSGSVTPSGTSPGSSPYSKSNGAHGVTWTSAKQRSARVNGYTSPQTSQSGFFAKHMRKISESLPRFAGGHDVRTKEKFDGGPRPRIGSWSDLPKRVVFLLSRRRRLAALIFVPLLLLLLFFSPPVTHWYRRNIGGGNKVVLILGANQGGGVMEWKGAREWAIERDSVKNKKQYAARWGYELEIVDMKTKKRYAHEWRESWEKVDAVRNAMKKYPNAEWFWWLDLHTFIMEPSKSLQKQLFNNLERNTYRDINIYNPLKIQHPPNGTSADLHGMTFHNYLDEESRSPVGDGNPNSVFMLLSQDCGGFNLGSFFMKRSQWADRIMDIWWDPVFYEQKHMEWEHKEQDALEYIYTNQPWIRSHVGFVPQRRINSFPPGACGPDRGIPAGGCSRQHPAEDNECGVQGIHYQQKERDFLVNMAGCEWGRDCWGEIYSYRQLSNHLNRNPWEKIKDWVSDTVKHIRGKA